MIATVLELLFPVGYCKYEAKNMFHFYLVLNICKYMCIHSKSVYWNLKNVHFVCSAEIFNNKNGELQCSLFFRLVNGNNLAKWAGSLAKQTMPLVGPTPAYILGEKLCTIAE